MPDQDIISRNVPGRWRRPMRLLVEDDSPPEVARAISKALAATLRDHGGFPGFTAFCDLIRELRDGRIDGHSAYTRADAIEHAHQHHRHTKIAALAAKGILFEFNQGQAVCRPIDELLAVRCCRGLIDHGLFAYLRPDAVGKHFPGAEQAAARKSDCLTVLDGPLESMARRIAADPGCRAFRASPIPSYRKRSTVELLSQPIG